MIALTVDISADTRFSYGVNATKSISRNDQTVAGLNNLLITVTIVRL